jgi:hypothetical protein
MPWGDGTVDVEDLKVLAKYVKLTIETSWGTTPSVGLSEVRFLCIPDRTTTKP